jgi:hypothetical protein
MAFRRPAGPGEGPPSILGVPTVDASVRLSIIFDARFVAVFYQRARSGMG